MRLLVTCVTAFLIAAVAGRIVLPVLKALKAGQSIREIGPSWHNVKSGTPTMGGIVFMLAAAFAIPASMASISAGDFTVLYVYLFALAFGLIGFADDFIKVVKKRNLGLRAKEKALLQVIAAVIYLLLLYRSGRLTCDIYLPFLNMTLMLPPAVYFIFAVFVIVGCVNAVNLTDGVDGLATGVTIPVMVLYLAVALHFRDQEAAMLASAVTGGLFGFLLYNFHPAKMFMGDTGSLFLGGAVCGLAFALDLPMILLFAGIVYIAETLSVILQVSYFKMTRGKRLFKMSPIHHHFELCGWSEYRIFTVFTAVSTAGCLLAYLGVIGRA